MSLTTTQIVGSKTAITLTAMVAGFLAFLNISVVNVALSNIRSSFGTPLDQISWISTSYMIANIIIIPMTGWFQKKFGFRSYFAFSIVIFTLGSILCGLAWDLNSLILFRVIQGIGGGAIIPTSQAILLARYPKEEIGMAGAIFGLGAILGPLLGPTVGGYLIELYSWHWIFFMNVPIGIILIIMVVQFIHEPQFKKTKDKVDVFGIILLSVGVGTLQYCLEEGNRKEWTHPIIIIGLTVSIISIIVFIVHENECEKPVVNLSVFTDKNYCIASFMNFILGICLFSGSFMFALFCGSIMNYSAL
ncbi:MAG: DHA2 family efflux MFS transporter permease subunit, partial [Silvanigrellaceae bacterium]|nr:DHA2 family efflux MFS transporter permease subunit [Silvanigrellaceae bacterium]